MTRHRARSPRPRRRIPAPTQTSLVTQASAHRRCRQSHPGSRPPPKSYQLPHSVPGVFAVGDVRAGSVKRVASAAGAGAIAVQLVHEYLSKQHG